MSACVVRALLGGEVIHAMVLPESVPQQWHAWNRLPDGNEIDLTREQFPSGQQFRIADFPEDLIRAVAGPQAALLLTRVRAHLARILIKRADSAATTREYSHLHPPTQIKGPRLRGAQDKPRQEVTRIAASIGVL